MRVRPVIPRHREPPLTLLQNNIRASNAEFARAWRRACALTFAVAAVSGLACGGRCSAATVISYVGRVASAASGTAATTVSLTATRQVAAGDALLLSVLLRSTSAVSGSVTVSDAAGNSY